MKNATLTHKPCLFENKEFSPWMRVKKPGPWGWFFNYYEMKVGGSVYFDREGKLDPLFTWLCTKLGPIAQRLE